MKHFDIFDFNEPNLLSALAYTINGMDICDKARISHKKHFNYLLTYLKEDNSDIFNCETILIEYNYFSESYFDDYLNYYASCYASPIKVCKRIHFFTKKFTENDFYKALKQDNKKIFDTYLGYVVVRPIPTGVIGVTLLKHYEKVHPKNDPDNGKSWFRYYTATKKYYVNLFGKQLTINTMIFQEQDNLVSNCATSSLWFALHQLNDVFGTPILSATKINNFAWGTNSGEMTFNSGFGMNEYKNVIHKSGLTLKSINFENSTTRETQNEDDKERRIHNIKASINAYLRLRVPIFLVIELYNNGNSVVHTATINGYRLSTEKEVSYAKNKIRSNKIDRIFAHDDQCGPFAKIEFIDDISGDGFDIITTIKDEKSIPLKGKIIALYTPLSKNIKYSLIQDYFDNSNMFTLFKNPILKELIYLDIYLIESNKYKEQLIGQIEEGNIEKSRILFTSLPKYIWVMQGFDIINKNKKDEKLIFDIIVDPFNLNNQIGIIQTNIYAKDFEETLSKYCDINTYSDTNLDDDKKRGYVATFEKLSKLFSNNQEEINNFQNSLRSN